MRRMGALVALGLVVAACSMSEQATDEQPAAPEAEIVDPTPGEGTDGGAAPAIQPVGVEVNEFALEVNTCFNRYTSVDEDTGTTRQVTTVVDCSEEHYGEVYAEVIHPAPAGAGWPGDEAIDAWAVRECYRRFADFVGETYELSELEIGTVHPTFDTWIGAGQHRRLSCYVHGVDGGALRGSMRDTAL